RIQVEHPVTELVTGFDLIKEQIRVAAGEPLSFRQEDVRLQGWAVECRINAENVERNFMPSPGKIIRSVFPGGPGVRVDSHIYSGYIIPPNYDSMVAKLITYGRSRDEAIARMRRALDEFVIEGVHTTIDLQQVILNNRDFLEGKVHTKWLESLLKVSEM
ncbi:MAG TPA: acetyl-CoA carboxylase biotin carboxylase subunit, partial [bacterium]|nr:acetyl-CoA carboxylase biotin carboxylase subunit [bacterium]